MENKTDMKNAGHLRWLYQEIPELVAQGVIQPETVEQIRRYYGEPAMAGSTTKRWAIVLFGILGALLIGGGIILLLAHNWEELSRPMRAVISVTPLSISAALGAWLIWTERDSTAWSESVATAQTLAIGTSIALVAQTYNLGGRFDEFMLTWSLLALPVAYLLQAAFPALLYLVGIVAWTGSVTNQADITLWYFPLLAAALPFLWWISRQNRYHPRPIMLSWAIAITVCIGSGLATEQICGRLHAWPVLFGGLFALLYLVGARWWDEAPAAWQRPFQNVGALGAVGLGLILSYGDVWLHVNWSSCLKNGISLQTGLQMSAAAIFPTAALVLWVKACGRKAWDEIMLGAVTILTAVGWIAAMYDAEMISTVLSNLYLIILGIGTLVTGFRLRRLGTVNAGMAVLASVILCRFFDSDLNFLIRGVAFIVTGIGFLITNWMLLQRKGAVNG